MDAKKKNSKDIEGKKTKRRELKGFAVLIIIAIGIIIGLVVYFVVSPPGDSDLDPSKLPKRSVIEVAIQNGIQSLIQMRSSSYSWPERQNAEAIMALRLGNLSQFPLSDPTFLLSVQAMELELLGVVSSSEINETTWTNGKLGQYVVALVSVCRNPMNFYGHDLIQILKNQLRIKKSFYQTQRFALSWVILGLCTSSTDAEDEYLDILAEHPGNYTFGTDEASMIVMALSCVNNSKYQSAQEAAEEYIQLHIRSDNTFGNIYSTGLAVQAMTRFVRTDKNLTSLEKIVKYKLAVDVLRNFSNVATANQILPALANTSYVDVKDMCPPEALTTTVMPLRFVHLKISVRNFIISPVNVSETWNVSIGEGQTVYQGLQKLQSLDPTFNFTSVSTSWGQSITSIVNIVPDADERQYFQFLEYPDIVMPTGVSSTIPMNDTHYIFQATTW